MEYGVKVLCTNILKIYSMCCRNVLIFLRDTENGKTTWNFYHRDGIWSTPNSWRHFQLQVNKCKHNVIIMANRLEQKISIFGKINSNSAKSNSIFLKYVCSQHVTQDENAQKIRRTRIRIHSDSETRESLHIKVTLTMFLLNENVIGLAAFHRNLQYENSLACTHQLACPFFWDIAPPDWMICGQPLWTTLLVRRFGHQSPSGARQYPRITEKSAARLQLPKSPQGSLTL